MIGNLSLTLRLSLLVGEFTQLGGKTIRVRIGQALHWDELAPLRDRKPLLDRLFQAVFELDDKAPQRHYRPHGTQDLEHSSRRLAA